MLASQGGLFTTKLVSVQALEPSRTCLNFHRRDGCVVVSNLDWLIDSHY